MRIRTSDVETKDSYAGRYLCVAAQLFDMVHDMRENDGLYWPQIEPCVEEAIDSFETDVEAFRPTFLSS